MLSIDEQLKELNKRRNLILSRDNEKKLVKLIKVYLSYYGISQKKLSKLIDVNHQVLCKVLNGLDYSVSRNQWDHTIDKLSQIDIQRMFDDMNCETLEKDTIKELKETDKRITQLKRLRNLCVRN